MADAGRRCSHSAVRPASSRDLPTPEGPMNDQRRDSLPVLLEPVPAPLQMPAHSLPPSESRPRDGARGPGAGALLHDPGLVGTWS